MFGKHFELNEDTLAIVKDIGSHMPGGFFIYRAGGDEELLYANQNVFVIYGCENEAQFRELTGYTFRGMVDPRDYDAILMDVRMPEMDGLEATRAIRSICIKRLRN